jgi:DNA-binding response OmpR family regulator
MAAAHSLSVPIIDNHPDAAESMAEVVRLCGHAARVACTGGEAVRLAEQSAPDVVILDIGLPDADGYAVAERLRRVSDRTPLVVVVTGFTHTEGRSRAAGIAHHFVKPVDPCVLMGLIGAHAEELAAVTAE